ncbi:helix-turn-helix domain-containing protein [Effusibacillus pohliae]|uniref:helix-turn-helix domain-containing protein n=1 Tax=Effusibacillus pohliae TaxID=232270 RepID=UPI00036D7D20|nr:helix-turn-helix transcriptional regulator [Effusibacillus pohliae]
MTLGERLKYVREKRNMSQLRVAQAIGISNVQLSRYEADERKPDPETLKKLAEFYETTTDYLLGLTDEPNTDNNALVFGQAFDLTLEEQKVLQEMREHPKFAVFFHDLASAPEDKIRKLIKMWAIIKEDIENDDDEEPED